MNAAAYKTVLHNALTDIQRQQLSFNQTLVQLQTKTVEAKSEEQLRQIARDTLALMLELRKNISEDRKTIQQAKQHFELTQTESLKTALTQ